MPRFSIIRRIAPMGVLATLTDLGPPGRFSETPPKGRGDTPRKGQGKDL